MALSATIPGTSPYTTPSEIEPPMRNPGNSRPRSWFRSSASASKRRDRSLSPQLEQLEERTLLTLYMVNTTVDMLGDTTALTLRDAITAAVTGTASGQAPAGTSSNTIKFAISGSGVQPINLSSALPTITGNLVIDGTSQNGYNGSPLIELNGASAGGGVSGLTIQGAGVTIEGLAIDGFSANGIVVEGAGSTGDAIEANNIGVLPSGTSTLANGGYGVLVENLATTTLIGSGNVISGNTLGGIDINNAVATSVTGNFIGTNAAGTSALGNGGPGILIQSQANTNTIGAGNIISGNSGVGVEITSSSFSNTVEGNKIGTNAAGTTGLANGSGGVLISGSATSNTIGGTTTGDGNVIAFNSGIGVAVGSSASDTGTIDNAIEENSIFGNTGLGIDLGSDGVTPNGTNPRSFPNEGQNYPVLTTITPAAAGQETVSGTFTSVDGNSFRLEFFGNTAAGSSGVGQGETFLGATTVSTSASGTATFSFTYSPVAGESFVSATATNLSTGDTSEFAQDVQSQAPAFTKGPNLTVDADDGAQTVVNWATNISGGSSGGAVTFLVSANNSSLFSVQPAINSSGTLTYTPSLDAEGTATITVQAKNGAGVTSAPQTFTITVLPGSRQHTIASATGTLGPVQFVIAADGKLYEHINATGWSVIGGANTVESVSAVADTSGRVVLFAEGTDHALSIFIAGSGWQGAIGAPGTVLAISAGLDPSGKADVFVVDAGGNLDEYSTTSGWRVLPASPAGAVTQLSAVDNSRVYVVTANGSIYGNDPNFGWFPLTSPGFARSISAVGNAQGVDTVYAVTMAGGLYRHDNTTGWAQLGGNGSIVTISAGRDVPGEPNVFAITTGGQIAENDSVTGWSILNTTSAPITLSASIADQLFAILADGSVQGYQPPYGFFPLTSPGFAET